ncbi:MAG TPA: NADAR family protein [Candidatus Paceibacterota bacterium]|nr:NADAR family protein [Candidatus Paceibacterota bacterium]
MTAYPVLRGPVLFCEQPGYQLTNFAAFEVTIWRRTWKTTEHAYQASKFTDGHLQDEIASARSPDEAKALAHEFKEKSPESVRKDWSPETKLVIMEQILRAKLEQYPQIQHYLLSTGDRLLVEDNPHDEFWGSGRGGKGENHLGKLWMKLRGELCRERMRA